MPKEKSNKQNKNIQKPKVIKMTNYPVGDFLIRFKNISRSGKKEFVVARTNLIEEVAKSLQHLGYIKEVLKEDNTLRIRIAYVKKEPVLSNIKIISKPGLRIYMGKEELESYRSPSFLLLSTSKGILSSREAIKKGVGGEVLAEVL
ncbi:MAG TPA: 30S ribosomal protein S8 [Patescibacteria group bacterium]|nr:30S ribosomal protein S8 [Patescibacteria group bacterium]